MHKILFYNKFIIYVYMFRTLCAHHQEIKIVLYSRLRTERPPTECDDTNAVQ